jgi:Icc-related predicted phosphoesterase
VRWPKPIAIGDDVDVVIAAGDTCVGTVQSCAILRDMVPAGIPIVAVLGNHEHYHSFIGEELTEARLRAGDYNVHLLDNDATVIQGVRFLGATFWTDYSVFGTDRRNEVMAACCHALNDHRLIGWSRHPWQIFWPEHALQLHQQSRAYLTEALAQSFDGPTVVVTHHGPHWNSVAPRYWNDLVTGGFVSDCADLIRAGRPELWVHGHTHNSADYVVGTTRVIANPHGYGNENSSFDPALIVEVRS